MQNLVGGVVERMRALRNAARRGGAPATLTALDVGTEFAKALVVALEPGDDGGGPGVVRGAGRQRQGLTHMQSGTVSDIDAVVANCRLALDEAQEASGPATRRGRDRHRRRAGQGDDLGRHHAARCSAAAARRGRSWRRSSPQIQGEALTTRSRGSRGRAGSNDLTCAWCMPPSSRSRSTATPSATRSASPVRRWSSPSSTRSRRWSTWERCSRWRRASSSSCSALSPSRTRWPPASIPGELGDAGAIFVDVGGGTTDVALVRHGGIAGTKMLALGGSSLHQGPLGALRDSPFPGPRR